MGRYTAQERAFLMGSFLLIGLVALLGVHRWITAPSYDVPEPAPKPTRQVPAAAPSPAPPRTVRYQVRGTARDLPGLLPSPAILQASHVSLRAGNRVLATEPLSHDASFDLWAEGPESGVRLRLTTRLILSPFDGSLDRDVWIEAPVTIPEAFFPDLDLPRSLEFGEIRGHVLGASGAELVPLSLQLDPVEGTTTPNIGLARGAIGARDAPNAPAEVRVRGAFLILHVPPGTYELRARVIGRLMLPSRITVSAGRRSDATIAEGSSSRRLRGILRDARTRRPIEGAEVETSSVDYAGPATRDPLRMIGRTSPEGRYDMPLPDVLPAEGLLVRFAGEGYRGTDTRLTASDFHEGVAKLDVDLARE